MKITDEAVQAAVRAQAFAEFEEAIHLNGMSICDADVANKLIEIVREYCTLSALEPSPRDQALEEAAQALEKWGDIYGNKAAAAIRALKSQPVQTGGGDDNS